MNFKYFETLKKIIKISRPRFWSYTAGTFAVGYIIGISKLEELHNFSFLYVLFCFLIPLNIFLYGINDLFDWDTDHLNVKKESKEYLLVEADKSTLKLFLILAVLLSLPCFLFLPLISIPWFVLFLLLAYFYSAEPIRFKKRPILDSASNFLYVIPGIIGFLILSENLNPLLIFGFFCWTTAMHLFSAIPDIIPDSKAGIKTTATVLGFKKSLIACFILWFIFSLILINYSIIFFPVIIYPIMPILVLFKNNSKNYIDKIYWYFPYINSLLGFIAFWYFFITNLL